MDGNNVLSFRPADTRDLSLLTYWDTLPHLIKTGIDGCWEWEKELKEKPLWREMWIAEVDGESLGFLQIMDAYAEDSHYWGNVRKGTWAIDIWIGPPEHLGKGWGTKMMQWGINRCFREKSARIILVDPLLKNKRAHRFYEKMGFYWVKNTVLGGDETRVYALEKSISDEF